MFKKKRSYLKKKKGQEKPTHHVFCDVIWLWSKKRLVSKLCFPLVLWTFWVVEQLWPPPGLSRSSLFSFSTPSLHACQCFLPVLPERCPPGARYLSSSREGVNVFEGTHEHQPLQWNMIREVPDNGIKQCEEFWALFLVSLLLAVLFVWVYFLTAWTVPAWMSQTPALTSCSSLVLDVLCVFLPDRMFFAPVATSATLASICL